MTTNGQPGTPPPPGGYGSPENGHEGRGKRFALVAVLLVVIAGLASAAGIVMVNRNSDDVAQGTTDSATEVAIMDSPSTQPTFEPAGESGTDAFFPVELQLTSFQQEIERDIEQQALNLTEEAEDGQVVDPDGLPEFDIEALQAEAKTGIFGGTAENTCNPERLISFLYANPDLGEAWAQVQGITFAEIAPYIRSLEVRVLAEDVAVLNHGFDVTSGAAYEIDSVLAAGTAVLVDENGDIRTRCFCGNPIRPRPQSAPMPPRCLVIGGLVHVAPASAERRTGLASSLDVLLTGRQAASAGQYWFEIKWGNNDNESGWTLESNLRKHYCPPPTNYDHACPGDGQVNAYVDPERTIKAGEVTGTVITADGAEPIFAPISPVGGPGGEVIFNNSLLIRFTQAFPSVQNSAWVHLDDLNNDDCVRIDVCISTDGPIYDRMNGVPIAPALTKEHVSFTGHFANDPVSHAEIRFFDGAGTTGWIGDSYTSHTDSECRETPDTPVVDCAEGTWTVWQNSTTVVPDEAVGVVNNAELLVFPNPAQDGRKAVQMGLPGSSVGPTGWIDETAFLDNNNHCGTIPLCVSTVASAWSIHRGGGSEIAPFTKVEGAKLHGQWVYTGFTPVTGDRIIEVAGASGWIDTDDYVVHFLPGECEPTPPGGECVNYQTPDPTNGQDPNPSAASQVDIAAITQGDDTLGDADDSSTEHSVCCIEGPLYLMAGGPDHLDTIGSLWVHLSGATAEFGGETWFETSDGFWFAESQTVNPERCQPACPTIDFIQIAATYNPGQDVPELPDPITPADNGECCVTALYVNADFGAPQIDVGLGANVEVIGGPIFADGAHWYLTADGYWFPQAARTFDEDCTNARCPIPEIAIHYFYGDNENTYPTDSCCISGWAEVPGGDIVTPLVPERVQLTGDRLIAAGELWFETIDGTWVPESLFLFTTSCDTDSVGDPFCPSDSLITGTPLAAGTVCCVQGEIYTAIVDGLVRDIDTPTGMSTSAPTINDGTPWFPVIFEGDDYFAPQGNFVPASDCDQTEPTCPNGSLITGTPLAAGTVCCVWSLIYTAPVGGVSRSIDTPTPMTLAGASTDQNGTAWHPVIFEGDDYFTTGINFVPASECAESPQSAPAEPVPTPAPTPVPCRNSDQDSHCDSVDNCDFVSNEDQSDSNGNQVGDACDQCPDADQDQVCDSDDTCPTLRNIGDSDQDGIDDACDQCIDADQDFACEPADNCIGTWNPDQFDTDNDGLGDECDTPSCPTSQQAGNGDCCLASQAATSNGCFEFCPDGSIDFGSGCCPTSQQAGNGDCCLASQAATSDGCFEFCPDGSVDFGSGCCPTSQQAGNGDCCLASQAATSNGCFEFCPDGSIDSGNGCDPCYPGVDSDNDGLCDNADNCPNDPANIDSDGDGVCDPSDTCPLLPEYSTTYPNYYIDANGQRVDDCTELI